MKKRLLSLLMAAIMVFSLMPTSVLATDAAEEPAVCAGLADVACAASAHVEGCGLYVADASAEGEATDVPAEGEEADVPAEGEEADVPAEGEEADVPAEGEEADVPAEGEEADAPAEGEEVGCIDSCILAEGHEGQCVECTTEGCLYAGDPEHKGIECWVWVPCALTEGCELANGHEGECSAAVVYAPATIRVSNDSNTYRNKYVVISNGTTDAVYYINSNGTVVNTDGSAVTFEAGTYTIYYGRQGGSAAGATVTVAENAQSVSVRLEGKNFDNASAADQFRYGTSVYYNATSFNHVDIRVAGSYIIQIGNQSYSATVSNPSVVVKVDGSQVASRTWTGTTSYEWRETGLRLNKSSLIEVVMTLDLTYTDGDGTHVLEDVTVTYDNVNNLDKFIDAIVRCDQVQGLDFTVSVEDIQEVIEYFTVTYEWKVYNQDGTYGELPAGAPSEPGPDSGIQEDTNYVYDAEYVEGTSFYDYENGKLYTFHGWDTWSHSSAFNVDVSAEGYNALDDGDTEASNNPTIPITADTYIYGYWTATDLPVASAHIAIQKVFAGEAAAIAAAQDLWFRIDPGIDMDGDGVSQVDVDYPMIVEEDGVYKLPVYQYDKPFVFTEHNADVPGYTRATTIEVSGENASGDAHTGDTVNVTLDEVYQGTNVRLGTVTYTNTYTKNIGTAVSEYPAMVLLKTASDDTADMVADMQGVEFTLYSDAACTTAVKTYTIGEGGLATIDFTGMAAGTYYLKETKAAPGYKLDPYVYAITLTAGTPVEELRDNQFVQVTYYTLSVTIPEGSDANYTDTLATDAYYRLHVYNDPILGSLSLEKKVSGDKTNLNGVTSVIYVHGPITRDENENITDIGNDYEITLDSSNNWKAALSNLKVGEYLIHESFASVHGYTWLNATYGGLTKTETYNGIMSYVFEVTDETALSLTITNNYKKWTEADFFIHKVDATNPAHYLSGAEFTLYSDEALRTVVTTKTTGADGYAHFEGFNQVGTYYLKETKAPAGYYLDDTVYKVEITAEGAAYTAAIYVKNSAGEWVAAGNFNGGTDLLTVTNTPIVGKLTIKKNIVVTKPAGQNIPAGLASVMVNVSGPGSYETDVELNAANGWEVTLTGLALGEYIVTEHNANVPGYTLDVSYTNAPAVLAEAVVGKTAEGTVISGTTEITNTYTRNEETYEIPTSLTIKKTDENGKPLAGAVFTLTKFDGTAVSFTTNAEGIAKFELMSGTIANGSPVSGEYTLVETSAPTGYAKDNTTWKIVVKEDDGKLSVAVLNEDSGIFEQFWQWIIGSIGSTTIEQNGYVLNVTNTKIQGELTVSKANVGNTPAAVNATVTGPNGYSQVVTLNEANNWTVKLSGLALGQYTVRESKATIAGYDLTVSMEDSDGSVTMGSDIDGIVLLAASEAVSVNGVPTVSSAVKITNTYTKVTGDEEYNYPDLKLVKNDGEGKPLAGAVFQMAGGNLDEPIVLTSDENGVLTFPGVQAHEGTYTLTELSAPEGYAKDSSVYLVKVSVKDGYPVEQLRDGKHIMYYEYVITVTKNGAAVSLVDNTLTVVNEKVSGELTVTKKFGTGNAYTPDAIYAEVTGPNGYSTEITLNAANNWTVTLTGLELGRYVVTEKNADVPGYTLTTTMKDSDGKVANSGVADGRIDLDVGDLEEGYTEAVVSGAVEITNTYTTIYLPVEVTVNKVWENIPEAYEIPASVTVVLYKNHEEVARQTLSAENNWTYTWTEVNGEKLTDENEWTVGELPPEGKFDVGFQYTYDTKTGETGGEIVAQTVEITNTLQYTEIDVPVTKIWDVPEGYTNIPASVEVQLYRDGKAYGDPVKLSADNKWTYTWEDLPDCFTWEVKEVSVPTGYTAQVIADGNVFVIKNTLKVENDVDVTVKKKWVNNSDSEDTTVQPTSIQVTLYRDGKAYKTVTLSAENKWTHTWNDLADCFEWTVDETKVPTGYSKKVTHIGNRWTITNTDTDIPQTGDMNQIGMWAGLTGIAAAGFSVSLYLAFKKRKEEDEA